MVVGTGSCWSGVRQPLLLRDELVYPYLLRLLLLTRGIGSLSRLLSLVRTELPLELLVRHAGRRPVRWVGEGHIEYAWRVRANQGG